MLRTATRNCPLISYHSVLSEQAEYVHIARLRGKGPVRGLGCGEQKWLLKSLRECQSSN
jgi:hypothetical protein